MGLFENRSIILEDSIVNVEDWLTPGEAIDIFAQTGYTLTPQFQTPKMRLSEEIIKIEIEKGYTQEEAADLANITLDLFVQLELGREDVHIMYYINTIARLEES
ncbi:hypothetical protein MO163_001935 [Listeria monocytogenes]|uniref:hypothetical protein n=1 Tax=Listeria TaxID=1637 RepID=UPI000C86C199|nr:MULTISPECIES: hypothetical protein [Listeria]EAC4247898.1 hypothetical protein [Listeria monocytogenes]EAD8780285.1 hypothetical protein [Listeria monocytogenes]EAE1846125.1 hypothetical protein [Listeria monocytogenes]EAE4158310.1 hypothetical protein [Listeria monocytogenes]EAF2836013.1 hypothetical protein [Listeria monocytogenes]